MNVQWRSLQAPTLRKSGAGVNALARGERYRLALCGHRWRWAVKYEDVRAVIGVADRDRLPAVASAVWAAFGAGELTEAEAGDLQAAISLRTAVARPEPVVRARCARKPRAVLTARRERSRRWAAAGRMPPAIACRFTAGEQAALAVLSREIGTRGTCTLSVKAIGDLAGVSESTVKRAMREARALGLISIEERRVSRYRSETNLVRILDRAWLAWIRTRGGVQRESGTDTSVLEPGLRRRLSAQDGKLPLHDTFHRDAAPGLLLGAGACLG